MRRGSSAGTAAWVLAASAVLSLVSLIVLGLVGAQIRGFGIVCSAIGAAVGAATLLVAAGLIGALVWSSHHRGRIELLAASVVAWWDAGRRLTARRAAVPCNQDRHRRPGGPLWG